jgi:hypothetical protein
VAAVVGEPEHRIRRKYSESRDKKAWDKINNAPKISQIKSTGQSSSSAVAISNAALILAARNSAVGTQQLISRR